MATEDIQDKSWDDLSPSHQYLCSAQPDYNTYYNLPSSESEVQSDIQYSQLPLQFVSNTGDISSATWCSSQQGHSSPSSQTPDVVTPDNYNYQQEPPCPAIEVKDPSNKRRQQNRNSQIAHRQRNKKLIEDLRHEVAEFSEYSQHTYQMLQNLRQTTQALVWTIDQVLSRQPPYRSENPKERKSYRTPEA